MGAQNSILPLLFWIPILGSLVLSVVGIVCRRSGLLLGGAILAMPLSFYLNASPLFKGVGIVLPVFQLGAAFAVYKQAPWLAWILLAPLTITAAWLGFSVLSQG